MKSILLFQICGKGISLVHGLYESNITLKRTFCCCGNKTLQNPGYAGF